MLNLKNEREYFKNELIENTKSDEVEKDYKNIKFLNYLVKNQIINSDIERTFCAFYSIHNILYFLYSNSINSIILINPINIKKISEIRRAHNFKISFFKHYLDNNNKRDLVISISNIDNILKIWNIENLECIITIKYIKGIIYSACILNTEYQNYIITGYNSISIYDFSGNSLNEIAIYKDIFFIENYFDIQQSNNYIIIGTFSYALSYNYNTKKQYIKYYDSENKTYIKNNYYRSLIINNNKEILELIGVCLDEYIRIWNFHSGLLLKKIIASNYDIF